MHIEGETATMEPTCKYCQNPMVWLLALVWTVTWTCSFTEGAAQIPVRGEIGGNVTIRCPVDKQRKIKLFYFQRGQTFVNGFYLGKEISNKWENTRVDSNETVVHMYRLNISHNGDYECVVQYINDYHFSTVTVRINITANYSKPTVTTSCSEGFGCMVTCASHGGYPPARIMWDVPISGNKSSQMWKVVNNSEDSSPGNMTFTSSSTAYFNCSKGKIEFLRCSVGEITSDMFSVCTFQEPPSNLYVIAAAAICAMVVFTIIIMLLRWHCKRKTRKTETATWNLNGCGEEVTVLSRAETAP